MGDELHCVVRVLAGEEFLGSGFLLAPDRVLTCKHVVVERIPETGKLTEAVHLGLRIETHAGQESDATCRHIGSEQDWDLALLSLSRAIPISPLPMLWGLTETQEPRLRHAPIWVYGYPTVESSAQWRHPMAELCLLPSARAGTQILTQLQLTGGIPEGCSGGPAMLRWGEQWVYVGTVYLGGEEKATSRLIMADPAAEFMHDAGLHDFPRLDAPRALALVPADALDAEQLIERPDIQEARPNPYRGLLAFRESDAPYYFGREDDCRRLWAAVREQPFVALVGASGAGKSSLLFSGLAPLVRQAGDWQLARFRPGLDPFEGVAAALTPLLYPELEKQERRERHKQLRGRLGDGRLDISDGLAIWAEEHPEQHLVLIADQFEELYTQGPPEARQRFLDSLMSLLEREIPCTLLLSLRADFLSQTLAPGALAEAIKEYPKIILGALNEAQLRAAIERPAVELGVTLAPGLTDRILKDLGREPGTLPLLEFALTELWQRQADAILSHEAYDAIGGVGQALTHYADGEVARLGVGEEELRRTFVQLVRPGEGTEDTRQVATREQVGEVRWPLVKRLADARLVVTDTTRLEALEEEARVPTQTVEIVHEALIRHWQPMKRWLEADRKFRLWQNHLRQEIEGWEEKERDEGALLRGARLAEAQEQLTARSEELSPKEREYIEASVSLQERTRQAERRRLKLARLTAGVMTVLAIVALFSGYIAVERGDRAEQASQEAEKVRQDSEVQRDEALRNESRLLANLSRQQTEAGQAEFGILLALEALPEDVRNPDRPYVPEAEAALYNAIISPVVTSPRLVETLARVTSPVTDYSPDGAHLLTVENRKVHIWDSGNGLLADTIAGHDEEVLDAKFSPDGNYIATASRDNTARLWRFSRGEVSSESTILRGHSERVLRCAFSRDSRWLVTASVDTTARVWNVEDGKEIAVFDGEGKEFVDAEYSPDQRLIATLSITFSDVEGERTQCEQTIRLWDAKTAKEFAKWSPSCDSLFFKLPLRIIFSPNGEYIWTDIQSKEHTVHVFSASSDRSLDLILRGHTDVVADGAFSPDGSRFITASKDDTARVWDMQSGNEIAVYRSLDRWNDQEKYPKTVALSPSGRIMFLGYSKRMRRPPVLLDTTTLKELGYFDFEGRVNHVEFSPDGNRLVTQGGSTARLWEIPHAFPLAFGIRAHDAEITSLAFSPDSSRFVTTGDDRARIWDTVKGTEIATLSGHGYGVHNAAFSPDGKFVVTTSDDKTARVWNVCTRALIHVLRGHDDSVLSGAFSPDGRKILTTSSDNTVRLWNAKSGAEIAVLRGHADRVWHGAYSRDGQRIVTASEDGTARVWDGNNGAPILTLRGDSKSLSGAVFSPDGRHVVTASNDDSTARLWDALSGIELSILQPHGDFGTSVAHAEFSADGRYLVTAEAEADTWETETGHLVATIKGQCGLGQSMVYGAFTPNGQRVVAVTSDESVHVADTASGKWIAAWTRIGRPPDRSDCQTLTLDDWWPWGPAALSPDGHWVVTGWMDGTVRRSRIFTTTQELIDYARRLGLTELSAEERERFGLSPSPDG